ncbi:MAG TPA: hypothetical protein DEB24_02305 [Coriobacteriia bacterium]|nr:hypothetical protein [Coriobacteriia bacterium]
MCYCCNLCNRCGRADEMKDRLGKRLCFSCGLEASDNTALICPECGSKLPPGFPDLPTIPTSEVGE